MHTLASQYDSCYPLVWPCKWNWWLTNTKNGFTLEYYMLLTYMIYCKVKTLVVILSEKTFDDWSNNCQTAKDPFELMNSLTAFPYSYEATYQVKSLTVKKLFSCLEWHSYFAIGLAMQGQIRAGTRPEDLHSSIHTKLHHICKFTEVLSFNQFGRIWKMHNRSFERCVRLVTSTIYHLLRRLNAFIM